MQLRHASRPALWLRRARVATLAAQRFARWWTDDEFAGPDRVAPDGPVVYAVRVPIARAGAHPRLEAGKRANVRLAAAAFHGVVIAPDRPLSFWRTLGPATAERGFTWGMELRSGCAVPAIGGGLCLVSNALFAIAVELGWTVLERHGHSMALADPAALDATVAYPYVDLRIAPRAPARTPARPAIGPEAPASPSLGSGEVVLDVAVRGDVLVVAVRGHDAAPLRVELDRDQREAGDLRDTRVRRRVYAGPRLVEDAIIVDDRQRIPRELRTCLDCGETACHARVELDEVTPGPAHGAAIRGVLGRTG